MFQMLQAQQTALMNEFFNAQRALWRLPYDVWTEFLGDIAYATLPPLYERATRAVPFEKLFVGQSATSRTRMTRQRLLYFARASGDWNKAHMRIEGVPPFKGAIAHGFLTGATISAMLATELPGPGTVYLSQSMKFMRPIHLDEIAETTVTIAALDREKRHVTLETVVRNKDGKYAIEGTATVMVST